nr:MAG TPA: hypothetical protein [Caudoviricetes sp.]
METTLRLNTIMHNGEMYWRIADVSRACNQNLDNAIKQTQVQVEYLCDEFSTKPMRCINEDDLVTVSNYLKRRNAADQHAACIGMVIKYSKAYKQAEEASEMGDIVPSPVVPEVKIVPDTVYADMVHPQFGVVRTMTEYGYKWYSGFDVAKILKYPNPNTAVNCYCGTHDNDKKRYVPDKNGKRQFVYFVSETDVYSLIYHSKYPYAKEFQDWMFPMKKEQAEVVDSNEDANCNAVQVFSNPEFGNVRTVPVGSELWFAAVDVCNALDIGNPSQAVSRLDDDEKMTLTTNEGHSGKVGGAQMLNVISEAGLYSLIVTSRKPEAKAFKRWITHEVIPTIRKTGGYIASAEKMVDTYLDGYDDETKSALSTLLCSLKKSQDANIELQREIALLARQTRTYEPRAIVNALIRSFAYYCLDNDFKKAFRLFYKDLQYKKSIALNMRLGGGSQLDRVRDDEWGDVVEVAVALCKDHGVDIERAINPVNTEMVG